MPVPGVPEQAGRRYAGVRFGGMDTLRGAAIAWMIAYHFSFDLNWFGFIHVDFYRDSAWLFQRASIVSMFVFTAGLTQAWGDARGRGEAAFLRRWMQIFGCGLLVVLGSWLAFPDSFIYFGILQGMAAMLLVHHLLTRRLGALVLLLAPVALIAPHLWGQAAFDGRWLNWTGLIAHKPVTEDYVPLLPWFGVFALGAGAGRLLRRVEFRPLAALPTCRPLAWLGRRPLTIYMVHQPVLVGVLWLTVKALAALSIR